MKNVKLRSNHLRSFWVILMLIICSARAYSQAAESPVKQDTSQAAKKIKKAKETLAKLDQTSNYTESLAYADMNVLPMGIKQTLGNMEVTIAVSDIRWETAYSELTVFARVKIGSEKPLFFGAQGIKLSHDGNIIGDASLVLMGDLRIPINGNTAALILKGNFDINIGRANQQTYISMDCQGFKEMGIDAEVEFPESLMTPVDITKKDTVNLKSGEKPKIEDPNKPKRVRGAFKTVVKDWNDILVGISLPPFEIKGLKGFIFSMQDAILDLSDLRNDPGIKYPVGYEAAYMIPGNPALWRGVFIRDLRVTLPEQFAKRQNKERVSFLGHNMLLDNNGISGLFGVAGILPIDQGNADGWRFSVDNFLLELEANTLKSAQFTGLIGLPVSEKSNLAYEGIISADDEYLLKVKNLDTLNFDVFRAKAQLLKNSYVQLKVVKGVFKPEAMLHGSLNFAAQPNGIDPRDSTKKPIAVFKGIEFRSLHLKTDAPIFTAEYFGYRGEIKMMNFPISISRIGFRSTEKEVALYMDIKLTLSDNLFTGTTSLEFVGDLKGDREKGEQQHWGYKKINISGIAIEATIAEILSLKANLTILSADPLYGDGFAGGLILDFKGGAIKGLKVEARAMFGRKDFRYWFVDGSVALPGTGIPMGMLNLTGFSGGICSRMKRDVGASTNKSSGVVYVPDKNTNIGIKAGVMFTLANDAVGNGEASFEIAFNDSGGLNFIGFYGAMKFMGKIPGVGNIEKFMGDKLNKVVEMEKKFVQDNPGLGKALEKLKQYEPTEAAKKTFVPSEAPGEAGFSASVGIQYDFTQSSLHATFDLYVNAMGGIIRGTASKNRAGWAVIHIEPKEWYVHMGTPTDRLGLKMGIAGVSVETGAYLMLGSRIPGSPPPPQQVADILEVDMSELDYMRDLNALGDGKGFAFGASLKVETGDITFLILYANFQAGLGFDIMLKDYGDAQCKGRSGKVGIDGWYANGQAYVYLQGEVGIKVDLWFVKGKFPIISGAAAALIQAKLPNPSWFRGYLGVKFNILGGLVSGSCRFKFTIGDECELVIPGGSPVDIRMISDIAPKNNSKDIDVFTAPNVAFNMKVGVPFSVEDESGVKTYRISLNEFVIKNENKEIIEGKLQWNDGKDGVSFLSHEVLPPNKPLKAIVKVGFEEWQSGRWAVVYTAGKKAQEIMEVSFTTGTAPDVIPIQNVEYSYPVVAQKFFLKGESTRGVVQLKRGQSYLFSTDFKYEIDFTKPDGSRVNVPFTYNSASNKIEYTLADLANQQQYGFDVILLNKNGTGEVVLTEEKKNIGNEDELITQTSKQAGVVIRSDVGKSLLNYQFTTSRHNTLAEKVNSMQKGSAVAGRLSSDVINLQYDIKGGEPFDAIELAGSAYSNGKSLVEATAMLTDDYYKQDIYPSTYQTYPVAGMKFDRDDDTLYKNGAVFLGIPPIKAIPISTAYLTEVEENNFSGLAKSRFPFIYNLPQLYKEDFVDMQHKIVNRFSGKPEQAQYNYMITGYYKFIRYGYYKIKLQYIMPDGTKGTEGEFEYFNFIK
jgi:hypothetical protein